jgi:hypothetical protein
VTWDGQGIDPWLPERLNARIEAAAVERDLRAAFWAALSDWMVRAARRVLRVGTRPDLDAVWALAPAWRDAVELIVQGEIWKALDVAYSRILGDGYPWDQRPFAVRYLAEVRNRLVRIPDEVYDLIAGQVAQAVNLGEGIPKIASRVDNILSTSQSDRWPNRATTIARTETIGALNAGRSDAFKIMADDSDEPMEKLWLATTDNRTRATHRAADGQRVPVESTFTVGGFSLAFPGDPIGPAQEVIQCRCTMLLVEHGESVNMSNRGYRNRR